MELPESTDPVETKAGLDRRTVLRRGAVVGGAMVWTVPAVQTLSGAAFAAGSPLCAAELTFTAGGVCLFKVIFIPDATCCNCVATQSAALPVPLAIAVCYSNGSCKIQSSGPC